MARSFAVRVGDALQIGNDTVIRIDHKSGQQVKLSVETKQGAVFILDGAAAPPRGQGQLTPSRFTTGISGKPKPILAPT